MKKIFKKSFYFVLLGALVFIGLFVLWTTTIGLPDLNNFEKRQVDQSTKIYDRTGKVLLYDVFGEHKRTVIPLSDMSENIIKATIAVEDKDFYKHGGIEISAIFRAIWNNITSGSLLGGQGGSTITQQVIKNALLTRDKTISRKLKEWILAPRLERVLTKDEVLEVYLNEIPYGGSVYGVQEAARRFFAKDAKDLSLTESAYLAALPQAPTYYSPYGNNLDKLENRKNFVLEQMLKNNFITQSDYDSALAEEVSFQKQEDFGIRAPHFVMYVIEELEKEYGRDVVESGGLKVTTTLDWELQEKAEEVAKRWALENKQKYDAENSSIVATDPKNGDILVMVGSRDYFDEEIDGNFNIATAERQPGSAFKPFVYAEAFNKGYRPETVVFDLSTEFSTTCSSGGDCYRPVNYDGVFRGPMTLRDALAQSVNIPAVKVLYLAGLNDSLNLAKAMGIETLTNTKQYGLTLVLGGGEVRPLDMASAYGIFANDGIKNEKRSILKIESGSGDVLFEAQEPVGNRVLSEQTARLISDVLSDNVARAPAFGSSSYLNFPNQDVAVKTGTTNDYRDAWIVGYTPNISVAAWAGNNDNRSMDKKVAGFIVAPMWNEFMNFAISKRDVEYFNTPAPLTNNVKPIIAGYWKGEVIEYYDTETGKPADENTSPENKKLLVTGSGGGIHSILHWVNKSNPLGPSPTNPSSDPQYSLWESAVRSWVSNQGISTSVKIDNVSNIKKSQIILLSPEENKSYFSDSVLVITTSLSGKETIASGQVYINNQFVGEINPETKAFSFIPKDLQEIKENNEIRITVEDTNGESYEKNFNVGIINR